MKSLKLSAPIAGKMLPCSIVLLATCSSCIFSPDPIYQLQQEYFSINSTNPSVEPLGISFGSGDTQILASLTAFCDYGNPRCSYNKANNYLYNLANRNTGTITVVPYIGQRAGVINTTDGAVQVNGKTNGTSPDVVSFSRGAQIAGNFYTTYDTNQGTVLAWYKPSNQATTSYKQLFDRCPYYYFNPAGTAATIGPANGADVAFVTASLTSGTSAFLAVLWDCDNDVSSTNNAKAWVNATTGTLASFAGAQSNGATKYIGTNAGTAYGVLGNIDYPHFYRYPATDAQIASIYNSGNGADPSTILPAEHLCFALRGDGTAEAWSGSITDEACGWNWSANKLTDWHGQEDDAWSGADTKDTDAADIKLGAASLLMEGAVTNSWSATAGNDYFIEVLSRDDGTGIITQRIDGVGLDTSGDNTWTDLNWCHEAGSTATKYAIFNPTTGQVGHLQQCQIVPSLVDKGGLESWASATNANGWEETAEGDSSVNQEDTAIHSGTYSANLTTDEVPSIASIAQTLTLISGTFYQLSFWHKADSGTPILSWTISNSNVSTDQDITTSTTFTRTIKIFRASSTSCVLTIKSDTTASSVINVDDISVVALSAVTLTATPATLANSAERFTNASGGGNGVGIRVDGADTLTVPTSGVLSASAGTIAAWVYPLQPATVHPTQQIIYHNSSGNRIYLWRNANVSYWQIMLGGVASYSQTTTSHAQNTWAFITATWNGTTGYIYYNGVLEDSDAYAGLSSLGSTFNIGNAASSNLFDGYLFGPWIWTRCLSDAEILDLYNRTKKLYLGSNPFGV